MAKEIGRLHSFWVWIEAIAGTPASIDTWIPLEEGNLKPIIEIVKDESAIWVIEWASDSHVTKTSSEFTAKGIVRSKSFPWVLFATLWTCWAPSLVETWVYTHAMTRLNSNSHPACTVIHDNTTQEEQASYCMVDSLKLAFEIWSQAKFDLKMMGKLFANTTGNTPTFVTLDEPFLVSNMCVKFASTVAGLTGATPVPVQSVNFEIAKNLNQIYSTSTTCGTEVLNFASQHNQQMDITGDMEIIYDADTYKTLAIANTQQAIWITITGKTLIGATKYNQLTFVFANTRLEDWDRSMSNNEIVSQTFGFSSMYSVGDTSSISATVQNTISAQYA